MRPLKILIRKFSHFFLSTAEYQYSLVGEPIEIQTVKKNIDDFTVTYVDYQEQEQNSFETQEIQESGDGEEGSELTFITSPWATKCLVANNFLYNCHSSHGNKTYWR